MGRERGSSAQIRPHLREGSERGEEADEPRSAPSLPWGRWSVGPQAGLQTGPQEAVRGERVVRPSPGAAPGAPNRFLAKGVRAGGRLGHPGAPMTEAGVEASGSPQGRPGGGCGPKQSGRGKRLLAAAVFWGVHDWALLTVLGESPVSRWLPEADREETRPHSAGPWSWAVLG